MKKLSVKQELIKAKYQYPAHCTTYDKEGNITSSRVVTHSIKATDELIKLHPQLATFINTYDDDEIVQKPGTVKELMNQLGK